MSRSRKAPCRDGDCVANLGPEPVHKPTEPKQADTVSELERRVYKTELLVGPANFPIKDFFQQGKDLAIDVIDGGSKKKKHANDPAIIAGPTRWQDTERGRGGRFFSVDRLGHEEREAKAQAVRT